MPTAAASTQWPALLENIKADCPHNRLTGVIEKEQPPTAPTPQKPATGATFSAVADAANANLTQPYADNAAVEVTSELDLTGINAPNPFDPAADETGPGSQVKKFLSRIGITATPTCSCNAKARHMDAMGIEWCEQNVDTIVDWLREEAQRRGLPFIDMAGRVLVNRAIAAAKKARANKIKKLNAANGL